MQRFASRVPIEKSFRFRPTYIGFGSIFESRRTEVFVLGIWSRFTSWFRDRMLDGIRPPLFQCGSIWIAVEQDFSFVRRQIWKNVLDQARVVEHPFLVSLELIER